MVCASLNLKWLFLTVKEVKSWFVNLEKFNVNMSRFLFFN